MGAHQGEGEGSKRSKVGRGQRLGGVKGWEGSKVGEGSKVKGVKDEGDRR